MSPGLEAVILKALDKDPELRYQTAKELRVDLERLQAAAMSSAASQPVSVVKPRRRWPWLVAAAAPVALGVMAWFLRPPPPPRITGSRPLTAGFDAGMSVDAGYASWTTDGTRLYYLGAHGAEAGRAALPVYWALFAGRDDWERLGDFNLTHPNWSRDGQSFVGLNIRARRIERWSKATRRLETVAEVGDIPLVSWVSAPWMGLAPDGSPLVVRDRSTRDLYALDWEAP